MSAMQSMLKDQFGIDFARLMQVKTDRAAASAEVELGVRTDPPVAGV